MSFTNFRSILASLQAALLVLVIYYVSLFLASEIPVKKGNNG